MSIRARTRVAVLALAMWSAGACTAWRPHPVPAAGAAVELHTRLARVTHADGSQRVLGAPVVEGDSIRGRGGAVRLRDVRRLEVRRTSAARTAAAALVVLGAAGAGVVHFVHTLAGP